MLLLRRKSSLTAGGLDEHKEGQPRDSSEDADDGGDLFSAILSAATPRPPPLPIALSLSSLASAEDEKRSGGANRAHQFSPVDQPPMKCDDGRDDSCDASDAGCREGAVPLYQRSSAELVYGFTGSLADSTSTSPPLLRPASTVVSSPPPLLSRRATTVVDSVSVHPRRISSIGVLGSAEGAASPPQPSAPSPCHPRPPPLPKSSSLPSPLSLNPPHIESSPPRASLPSFSDVTASDPTPASARPSNPFDDGPSSPPPSSKPLRVALYAYTATAGDQLSMQRGEVLELLDDSHPHWTMLSDRRGTRGLVPATYLRRHPQPTPVPALRQQQSSTHHRRTMSQPPLPPHRQRARVDDSVAVAAARSRPAMQQPPPPYPSTASAPLSPSPRSPPPLPAPSSPPAPPSHGSPPLVPLAQRPTAPPPLPALSRPASSPVSSPPRLLPTSKARPPPPLSVPTSPSSTRGASLPPLAPPLTSTVTRSAPASASASLPSSPSSPSRTLHGNVALEARSPPATSPTSPSTSAPPPLPPTATASSRPRALSHPRPALPPPPSRPPAGRRASRPVPPSAHPAPLTHIRQPGLPLPTVDASTFSSRAVAPATPAPSPPSVVACLTSSRPSASAPARHSLRLVSVSAPIQPPLQSPASPSRPRHRRRSIEDYSFPPPPYPPPARMTAPIPMYSPPRSLPPTSPTSSFSSPRSPPPALASSTLTPHAAPAVVAQRGEAVHAFTATDAVQLSVSRGDELMIVRRLESGWCVCRLLHTGLTGLVPTTHVRTTLDDAH